MDWLFQHADAVFWFSGALLSFTGWNLNQGFRLKVAEEKIAAQAKELVEIRTKQDKELDGLMGELKQISVKLAHIEGFLTAKRQTAMKR